MLPSQSDFSPDFAAWAQNLLKKDREFVEHRAKFAPEPIRSIAKLVLIAAGVEMEKEEKPRKATR
jgi:hypothetical protein